MAERRIPFEEVDLISGLFGSFDSNIRILEDEYHVTAVNRGGELKLTGDDEAKVEANKYTLKISWYRPIPSLPISDASQTLKIIPAKRNSKEDAVKIAAFLIKTVFLTFLPTLIVIY